MDIKVIASGSTGNCYIISDGKTRFVLEAGVPLAAVQRGCGFTLTGCAGCLISHSHGDHAKHAAALLRKGVDIYASQGAIDACGLSGHRVNAIRAHDQFALNTWTCLPFDIKHDAPEPLGFLMQSGATGEKLLYFTDTPILKYKFSGVTHIMAECNYDRETLMQSVEEGITPIEAVGRICESHMGLDALLTILGANDLSCLRKIYLIHLSSRHADEKRIKRAVQEATGVEVVVC